MSDMSHAPGGVVATVQWRHGAGEPGEVFYGKTSILAGSAGFGLTMPFRPPAHRPVRVIGSMAGNGGAAEADGSRELFRITPGAG